VTDPGKRPHFVTIQRATATDDGYGGEVRTWHDHATGWARLRYGTGQERREAAQENASQTVTAEFDWNPTLAAVTTEDRLSLFDTVWDITSNIVVGGNDEVHITAVANLNAEVDS
jgi:SPP1 family predicted phage head-tail adaptor